MNALIFNDDYSVAYYEPEGKPDEETWFVREIDNGNDYFFEAGGMDSSNQICRARSGSFAQSARYIIKKYKEYRNAR